MKQVKLLFIIALLSITATQSWAINLATWSFASLTGGSNNWGPSPFAPTSTGSNITIVGLTRGSGVAATGTAAGSAWGGSAFFDGLVATSQTAATAVAAGNFVTFSVTANAGFNVSITEIAAYNIRRSNTGPIYMIWQYSLNGNDFTDIGSIVNITSMASSGNDFPAITLSGIPELQSVPSGTTITFRAPIWGTGNNAGTWYFNGDAAKTLAINGLVNSTPLSLNLVSFNGKSESNVNLLNWTTVNEKNVARYDIERGTDGRNFNKIATAKAKGNDNPATNYYSFSDEQATPTAYYRLRMTDMDGSANYSNVVVLHRDGAKPAIHIYPNPASDILYVEGLGKSSSYSITDVLGRNVAQASLIDVENTVVAINVTSLVHGVYFLQLADERGKQTIRFIKK